MSFVGRDDIFKKIPELNSINLDLCYDCKSVKLACGFSRCPLLKIFDIPKPELPKIDSSSVFGPSPQIFVGDKHYPKVFSGPLTSLNPDSELAKVAGHPSDWVSLPIDEIIQLRFGLLRGMKKSHIQPHHIKSIDQRVVDGIQEIAMSTAPVEIEASFTGRINTELKLEGFLAPQGPSGQMQKLEITGHSKVPAKVERVLNDEIKAVEQVAEISSAGMDVYYLQNIFSAGLTGEESRKKLVPTRWSITAVDDIVGKSLIQGLRDFKSVKETYILHGGFYGNYFTIIFMQGSWQFENFETWMKGSIYTLGQTGYKIVADHEGLKPSEFYRGKVGYSNQAGGYYAARLSILQYLHKIRRQAKVISIREITSEYLVPSGVWVVREAARVATESTPYVLGSNEELEEYLNSKLLAPVEEYLKVSTIFAQKTLDDFF